MDRTSMKQEMKQDLDVDVCVIGSGAGGSACAYQLAERGFQVVVIESGRQLGPTDFTQREDEMIPELFYESGGRRTEDRSLRILHGHGVGGSTVHNINLCKRLPEEVFDQWNLKSLKYSMLSPYYDQIEKLLQIRPIDAKDLNSANSLFKKGVEALSYRGGMLSHNRQGCQKSGFCELGCAYNAKMNALRVLLPAAQAKGAQVFSETRAIGFQHTGKNVKSLRVRTSSGAEHSIRARVFVLAAGAIEGPALLQRSEVEDPYSQIGAHLRLHPGAAVAGVFTERVESWKGIPQSFECTEFLDFKDDSKRAWLITSPAHPCGIASALPGVGRELREGMRLYPYLLPLAVMIHDHSEGRVEARGRDRVKIQYEMNEADREMMARGLRHASEILFAGGAARVEVPYLTGSQKLHSREEVAAHVFRVTRYEMDFLSVHPMGTLRMGSDPSVSACDEQGRLHALDQVYVADTSLFPTSIGVPPQWSAYAFGLYVADQIKK